MHVRYPKIVLILILLIFSQNLFGQELHATVTVISDRVRTVDARVFQSLQTAISEFINTRHWGEDEFKSSERIECNFVLNLASQVSPNVFSGSLTVQSVRPVYNTGYHTTMLNYLDNNVAFKYVQFQPLDFSDTRVSGDDPEVSNLTAILAYYAYLIIGLDYDSFSPKGGDVYFRKARNIVNNAPEDSKDINGWQPFESNQNRYWLVDNLQNARLARIHDVYYQYCRMGLDRMYTEVDAGRESVINCLNILTALNADNPNSMVIELFFTAKSTELAQIFSQGPPQDRERAVQLLTALDPSNAGKYQQDNK
jgi:hypothetical protein